MDFISSSLRLCKIRDDCGQAAIQLGLPYTETSLTVLTSSYLFCYILKVNALTCSLQQCRNKLQQLISHQFSLLHIYNL